MSPVRLDPTLAAKLVQQLSPYEADFVVPDKKKIPGARTKAQQTIDTLLFQIQATMTLPLPVREYLFAAPDRQWRFDLAWPDRFLAVELEGLVFPAKARWHEAPEHRLSGRHVSATGFLKDLEKYSEAWARGWSVLRLRHKDVEDGRALTLIERRFAL